MGHTYSNLLIHAIFGTKNRLSVLDTGLKSELFPYMAGITKNWEASPFSSTGLRIMSTYCWPWPTAVAFGHDGEAEGQFL
jgi:hypothetical protein